jgi:hypothetical protein
MQGIDEVNDALVYVCSAGIQATSAAASSTAGTPQSNLTAATANNIMTSAPPPGEFLNGTAGPADLDPSPASVWSLASRPTAAKKIW